MSTITFEAAKILVLARLRDWLQQLSEAERRRPRKIINFKPYSVLDLIREVEEETTVGRIYVFDECKRLGYVVE